MDVLWKNSGSYAWRSARDSGDAYRLVLLCICCGIENALNRRLKTAESVFEYRLAHGSDHGRRKRKGLATASCELSNVAEDEVRIYKGILIAEILLRISESMDKIPESYVVVHCSLRHPARYRPLLVCPCPGQGSITSRGHHHPS